jgi:hypothetical protein
MKVQHCPAEIKIDKITSLKCFITLLIDNRSMELCSTLQETTHHILLKDNVDIWISYVQASTFNFSKH